MKLIYWIKNRKSFPQPKKINLSNILNYAEAEFRHWQNSSTLLNSPKHIDEQSIWRLAQIKEKSPECIEKGFCRLCGCDVIDKSFEMDGCAGKCYPERKNEKQWNEFKKQNKINEIC